MKNYFIKFFSLVAFVCISNCLLAQMRQMREEEPPSTRWFYGGNFGLSFGDYTFINVSPQVGYKFTEKVAGGGGVNFQYVSIKGNNSDLYKTSQGVVGLNVFGRVYPIQNFMLQLQPEANYVFGKDKYNNGTSYKYNKLVPSLLAGGGVVLPTGRGAMILSVFYDVLQDSYSPYSNRPIVNIGYNMGF